MTPEDYEKAIEIFLRVSETPGPDRDRRIAEECGSEPHLRTAVARLVRAHDASTSLLDRPIVRPFDVISQSAPFKDCPPPVADGYADLRLVGEGASGRVYEANQLQPKRRVAIKVLSEEYLTTSFRTRFAREAEALATFRHRNIAAVYAVGSCADGRPFIAMEFIEGRPILEHVRTSKLDLRARLDLVCQLCDAVQHAHARMIVHRDLKPTNVLVALEDGRAIVKVIDFGIVHTLGQDEGLTIPGQLVGTPLYMSPEQAGLSETSVTARSDVYALGVILFELLAGSVPFQLEAGEAITSVLHRKRTEDPPRPSARVRSGARGARVSPIATSALVGDLDAIATKALARNPEDRYESAGAMRDDIQRHLTGNPVAARRATAFYELSRFVRRRRALAMALGTALVVIMIASIWVSIAQVHAVRANHLARAQLDRATMAWAASSLAGGDQRTAAAALDQVPESSRGLLWNMLDGLARGAQRSRMIYEGGISDAVRISDGLLVSDRKDRLWLVPEGAGEPKVIANLSDSIVAIAAPQSGMWVATIGESGQVLLIHPTQDAQLGEMSLDARSLRFRAVAVDDDGLCVRTEDSLILFSIPSFVERWRVPLETPSAWVTPVVVQGSIATTDGNGAVLVDVTSGAVRPWVHTESGVCAIEVVDRDQLLIATKDGGVEACDLDGRRNAVARFDSTVTALRVDVANGLLVVCTSNDEVPILRWPSCETVWSLPMRVRGTKLAGGARTSQLQFVGEDGSVVDWALGPESVRGRSIRFWCSANARVESLGASPAPELLEVFVAGDQVLGTGPSGLWHLGSEQWGLVWSGELRQVCRPHSSDRGVAWVASDDLVFVWTRAHGARRCAHFPAAMAVSLSSDGDRLACGSYSGEVNVFDVATGQLVQQTSVGVSIRSLAWRTSGALVIGDALGVVWEWPSPTTQVARRGQGPEATLAMLELPGGSLVTGHADGTLAFWSAGATHPTRCQLGWPVAGLEVHNQRFVATLAKGSCLEWPAPQ